MLKRKEVIVCNRLYLEFYVFLRKQNFEEILAGILSFFSEKNAAPNSKFEIRLQTN